jgi:hypothetical protein
MPHTRGKRYAVVSCHVERPLDDRCWSLFSALQARHPGGFRITALMRPPDPGAGEDERLWLERARVAAAHGQLGHHTHFVSPGHARPIAGGPENAERVRREAAWLREAGLAPSLFCGGGWYLDESVAAVLAELGYADSTATAFRPTYLPPGARRLQLSERAWLSLADGRRLLELPTTHSLGMAARALFGPLPGHLHVYFHDTDLLSACRRAALLAVLAVLGRRCTPTDVGALVAEPAPLRRFSEVASGP